MDGLDQLCRKPAGGALSRNRACCVRRGLQAATQLHCALTESGDQILVRSPRGPPGKSLLRQPQGVAHRRFLCLIELKELWQLLDVESQPSTEGWKGQQPLKRLLHKRLGNQWQAARQDGRREAHPKAVAVRCQAEARRLQERRWHAVIQDTNAVLLTDLSAPSHEESLAHAHRVPGRNSRSKVSPGPDASRVDEGVLAKCRVDCGRLWRRPIKGRHHNVLVRRETPLAASQRSLDLRRGGVHVRWRHAICC